MDNLALPRPAPLEERIRVRGCRNCVAYDSASNRCRAHPQPVSMDPSDWCAAWKWVINPRVVWQSAFAGREMTDAAEDAHGFEL